jgi:transposase
MAEVEVLGFEVVHPRCCGLDVHKKTVVACALTPEGKQIETFGTMTGDLEKLARWLEKQQIRVVAMESTGIYWVPIYNVLEKGRRPDELLVVNAQRIKNVPQRKTDVKDSEWIANLLRYGLLQGSRIPDREQRELRELLRHRTKLTDQRAQLMNRLHKLLEGANIKLSSVATDIGGVSAMEMIAQLAEGNEDPAALANLARGRMRSKLEELERALSGTVRPHHRFMLASILRQLEFLTEEIAVLDAEAEERMRPFHAALELLQQVPGIGERIAQVLIAELGTDMSFWATSGHLASWAKLCPGNNQSGGKRRRAPTGQGPRWLRRALIEAARAGVRTKGSYLGAQYRRLKGKGQGNDNRAIVAVAHTILVTVYHMLKNGTCYQDMGADYFQSRDRDRTTRRAIATLQRLGYQVTLEEVGPAA